MPFVPPTAVEIFQRFQNSMTQVGFTHWSQGSQIGAIGRTTSAYIAEIWNTLSALETQLDPSTSQGIYLDRLGAMFGVPRLQAQVATTLGQGPSLQFTNNVGATVTIPANTRIWNPDSPAIAYFTTQNLTLPGGQQGFVDIIAGSAGDLANVGTGILTAHNAGMGQASVTNVRPVGGGTMPETDADYRYRLSQALASRNGATTVAIQMALLAIPGISNVYVNTGARGNGSVDILVVPIATTASPDLLAACETAMDQIVAAGISWQVVTPTTVLVDVTIQLTLQSGTTLDQVSPAVAAAVTAYINNLGANAGQGGTNLIYNELVAQVMNAAPTILDSSINLTVNGEPTLQTNVITQSGQRLIAGAISIT